MTDLVAAWDAALCPDPLPDDSIGVACMPYIGGSSAFRVWTGTELARVAHMPKLPIWVPTPGVDNARQAGKACLARLRALGIPATTAAGGKQWVLADLETGTEPDPSWLTVFVKPIFAAGYEIPRYGSPLGSQIFKYSAGTAGFLVADYDGVAKLYPHPRVIGKQFATEVKVPGGTVDLDVLAPSVLSHLWV